jgi:hypothetical protein
MNLLELVFTLPFSQVPAGQHSGKRLEWPGFKNSPVIIHFIF